MDKTIRVLFVDDDQSHLDQATYFLENEKLDVITASSADEGLELLDSEDIDLIVSDYKMPGMDGLQFLKIVREEREVDIPFIILTGKGREEVAMEALNLGADRYLQKGKNPKSLFRLLKEAILSEFRHYNTEIEKEKAKKQWQDTFDGLPDIAILISPDHEIIKINKKGAEALEMDKEDLVGKKCYKVMHDQDEPIEKCPCEKVLETGKGEEGEEFEEDGRYYIASASPIFDEEGDIESLTHTLKDITKRKEKEKEARQSRIKFENLVSNAQVGIYIRKPEGKITYANEKFANIHGYEKDELIGMNSQKLLHPDTREEVEKLDLKDLKELNHPNEIKVLRKDGEVRYLLNTISVIEESEREKVVLGIAKDITERKRTENELENKKSRLQRAEKIAKLGTWELDPETDELTWSNENYRIFGVPKDEQMTYDKFLELVHPDDRDFVDKKANEAFVTGEYDIEHRIKVNGKTKWVREIAEIIYDEDKNPKKIIGSVQDITELKKAEQSIEDLKERKENLLEGMDRYRKIIETSPEMILLVEAESGKIVDANKRAENIFRSKREEIIGTKLKDHLPSEEIDSWDRIFRIREKGDMERKKEELHIINDEDDKIPVEVGTSSLEQEGKNIILGVFRDISERKEVEEREKFLHSLLRHDIRNKIQVIQGYHQLLRKESALDEEGCEYLGKAEKAIRNSIDLIEKIRILRQAEEEEIKEVDLVSVIDELTKSLEGQLGGMKFNLQKEDIDKLNVRGGPLLIEVFSNLIENSVKYSGGKEIRFDVTDELDQVICTIEDDGKGISEDKKNKIFNKGYTSDDERGTGLGLFLVRKLLEIYGGSIEVKDSELGGARFDIYLRKL